MCESDEKKRESLFTILIRFNVTKQLFLLWVSSFENNKGGLNWPNAS
jgi:hypothetical protein